MPRLRLCQVVGVGAGGVGVGASPLTKKVFAVGVRLEKVADQRDVVIRRPHEAHSLNKVK